MTTSSLIREKIETGSLDLELGAVLRNPLYKDKTAAEILNIYAEQREYETGSLKGLRWALAGWLVAGGGVSALWAYLTHWGPIL